MTEKSLRVLIVDDNKVVRRGLRMRLERAEGITVIGEASSGRDAIVLAHAERADVVLMDLHMPGVDGIEATRVINEGRQPPPKVILLTSELSDAFVIDAFAAGATSYLLKNHDTDNLVEVIRGVAEGAATISAHMTPRLLRELAHLRPAPADPDQIAKLTPAELRVVAALSAGVTSNEGIASALHVSVNTVRSQTASASAKLGLSDRTQLALWGLRNNLESRDL